MGGLGWTPLILLLLLNLWAGLTLVYKKDYPMGLVFVSYSVATGGLIWKLYLEG